MHIMLSSPQANCWDSGPSIESQWSIALASRLFRWPISLLHLQYTHSTRGILLNLLITAVPWLHVGLSDGRSRTLTDADVDTLAWRVLTKTSVLLNWKGHLEKATLSLFELMASGRRTITAQRASGKNSLSRSSLILKSRPPSHTHHVYIPLQGIMHNSTINLKFCIFSCVPEIFAWISPLSLWEEVSLREQTFSFIRQNTL